MTATVLGLAWAGLVLAGFVALGPAPSRVRAITATSPRSGRNRPGHVAGTPLKALAVLGFAVTRAARRPPPSPELARRRGAAAAATALLLALAPALAPLPPLAAWSLPRLAARRQERRRLLRLEADLPETVDLLNLAVGAGCNVPLALEAAARRGTGPLAGELGRVVREVGRGRRLADALDDLPARAGESARPLAAALASCERYGAPVVPTLERIADDVRRLRQRRAEEAARRVPVSLLFPLVLCILPAFALLTVGPLIAGALRELRL